MAKLRDPRTREEWQEAVDLAEFYLAMDSARQYGLVTGGPTVDLERCEEIKRRGKKHGVSPRPDAVERCMQAVSAPSAAVPDGVS